MNDVFLRACRREPVERVPVWFMRQAGRSLPEYRALKAGRTVLEMCRDPAVAAEATMQPVRRLGVDAAILFSDIVVPLGAMGVDVDIRAGVGPVIDRPIRSEADLARLRPLDPTLTSFVAEAIRIARESLEVPLIGFAGAPFTLACYLVEGGPSKNHARTRALMHARPDLWERLAGALADATITYLEQQLDAGVDAVQLFDSWAGDVGPGDYERYVLPSISRIFATIAERAVPLIYFGVGTSELLPAIAASGATVVGVDWRIPLDEARRRVDEKTVQGNLDPAVLLAPWDAVAAAADDVLQRGGGRNHVFNLGHGVLPETPPETLERLVEHVHAWRP